MEIICKNCTEPLAKIEEGKEGGCRISPINQNVKYKSTEYHTFNGDYVYIEFMCPECGEITSITNEPK
jgi:RNase P subunit RPR2